MRTAHYDALIVSKLSIFLTLIVCNCDDSAMELTLSLEKLTNEKLLNLHKVSSLLPRTYYDVKLADGIRALFIEVIVFRNANP